jgi:hypothetical protein
MAGSIKEKVLDSLLILNKMIDDCNTNDTIRFYQIAEIKKYFNDFRTILKRALIFSNYDIFNEEELKILKYEIHSVEKKIENISEKIS